MASLQQKHSNPVSLHSHDELMNACINLCWSCRNECQTGLYNHCLEEGGEHLNSLHVRLMTDCIQICQAAADAMTRQSPVYMTICRACADICEMCARSCEGLDDMGHCATACYRCADSCQIMATYGAGGSRFHG